jgi:hypothetical protein
MFDVNDWKRRFEYNSDRAERNASMDSGWSLGTANHCQMIAAELWRELAVAIAETKTQAKDFFDRPDLVAVQEAARFATMPETQEPLRRERSAKHG